MKFVWMLLGATLLLLALALNYARSRYVEREESQAYDEGLLAAGCGHRLANPYWHAPWPFTPDRHTAWQRGFNYSYRHRMPKDRPDFPFPEKRRCIFSGVERN